MSFKRLFISALVLLFFAVAIVQTALTFYFKHQIEQEILVKSQALSEKILANTKDKVHKKLIEIAPLNKGEQEVRFEFHMSTEGVETKTSNTQNVIERKIILDGNSDKEIELLNHNAEQIKAVFLAVENLDNMALHQSVSTEILTDNSSFDRFSQLIIWSILISCGFALLLALWLTNKLTNPINRLISAMDQLDQDKLGIQLEPTGVTELKKCANQFNAMSMKLANYAEQQTQLEQRKHLAQLGELSRGIAHALRNPVHTLSLTLEQYFKSSDQERLKLEQVAYTKIEHIDKNINALLSLAKDQVSRDNPVPIYAVLQDIKLELLNDASHVDIECDKNNQIIGLETEIRSILHTLLVNAVEASTDGARISVKVTTDKHNLIVDVLDQGQGVSEAIRPHLFEPHVSDKADGAGIGLYLAKQIITLYYDGSIVLVHSDEQGAHFRATFSKGH